MSTVDYNNNQLRFNVQRSTTVIFAPCLFIVLRGRFFLLHGHWQDQAYVTRWTWLHWILLEINLPPFDSLSTVSCDFALSEAFLPSCTILVSSRSVMAMASAVGKDMPVVGWYLQESLAASTQAWTWLGSPPQLSKAQTDSCSAKVTVPRWKFGDREQSVCVQYTPPTSPWTKKPYLSCHWWWKSALELIRSMATGMDQLKISTKSRDI